MTAQKAPGIRVFNLWVVARRSPDVAGEWEAHCLDLDIVTQGRSLRHVFEMAAEAVGMTLLNDLAAGREPTDRRAPKEFWDGLWRLLAEGQPIKPTEAFDTESRIATLAGQLQFAIRTIQLERKVTGRRTTAKRKAPQTSKWDVPAAWSRASAAGCASS